MAVVLPFYKGVKKTEFNTGCPPELTQSRDNKTIDELLHNGAINRHGNERNKKPVEWSQDDSLL
jgi:hypothetical protein